MNQIGFDFERKTPRRNHRLRSWLLRNALLWGGLMSVMALLWFLFIWLTRAVLDT